MMQQCSRDSVGKLKGWRARRQTVCAGLEYSEGAASDCGKGGGVDRVQKIMHTVSS